MQAKMKYANKALALFLSLGLCVGTVPMTSIQAATKNEFVITNPISAMHVGRRYNFSSTINGKYADTSVTWTSSNSSVATVDKYGNVITKKTGDFVITAKTKSGQKVAMNILSVSRSGLIDNQKDLERLLKSNAIKSIAIRQTERAKRFTIPEGDYTNKVVYINAGKSTLVNEGELKALTVVDLYKLQENGTENKVYIKDKDVDIAVAEKAVVDKMYIPSGNVATDLTVDGTVNVLLVGAKNATITMDGTGTVATTYVTPNGQDVTVETAILTTVKANNDAKVVFTEGAEGSKVELLDPTVKVEVENLTSEDIIVGDSTVAPGENKDEITTQPTPAPQPTPDSNPGTDSTPTEYTKTIDAVSEDGTAYYELPVDFKDLKSAEVLTGGKSIHVDKTVIDFVTGILNKGDANLSLWNSFDGTYIKEVGGIKITIESTEVSKTKKVTYDGTVYNVTVNGTNSSNISIDVTKKDGSNTYTLTKEGQRKLCISCLTNSAVGDMVSFKVTYLK